MADRYRVEGVDTGVSSATQLQNEAVVSGSGAPTHTPDRTTQSYVDTATGQQYEWWAAAWH